MLSLSGVSAGRGMDYYERDDYYFGAGEGRVILGRGLVGGETLSAERFTEIVRERLEATGGSARGEDRVADDLTFSAPKSVSLIAALDDERRGDVIRAHREAVRAVMEYVRDAGMIRARDAEGRPTRARDAVAAAFDHFLNRNQEPHLHTHVLVLNAVTRETDGARVAAHLREIYTAKEALGAMYRMELAARLEKLGYELEWSGKGTFEVAGFTEEQLRAFSTRREEIERALRERGLSGGKAAEVAALDTREAKREVADPAALRESWERTAREVGIEIPAPSPGREPDPARAVDAAVAAREAVNRLLDTAGFATDVRAELEIARELARAGAPLAIGEIRELAAREMEAAAERDGGRVDLTPDPVGRMRYTVHDNLSAELKYRERFAAEPEGVDPERAREALAAHEERMEREKGFRLDGEQREAVLGAAAARGDVAVIGRAGAGKTTMMEALAGIHLSEGRAVLGVAPSGAAASNLERETGVRSFTVDSLAFSAEEHLGGIDLSGGLLIVDEAGMLDARRAALVSDFATRHGMKIVFVGDPDQLKPVGHGDAFREIAANAAERGNLFTLEGIRRQRDPDYLRAAMEASRGNTERALEILEGKGWVREVGSEEDLAREAAEAYLRGIAEGKSTLVVTDRHALRRLVNETVRERLTAEGRVRGEGITLTVRDSAGRPDGERTIAEGDRVVFLRNDKRLGVANGDVGEVVRTDPERGTVAVKVHGRTVRVNTREYAHLDHAYALTVHKSQGQTVDRVIYAADPRRATANSFYVGITRGREEALVVTTDVGRLREGITVSEEKTDVLTWGLRARGAARDAAEAREIARRDAVRVARDGPSAATEGVHLVVDLERHAARDPAERIRERLTEMHALAAARETPAPAKRALAERIGREAEAAGGDPRDRMERPPVSFEDVRRAWRESAERSIRSSGRYRPETAAPRAREAARKAEEIIRHGYAGMRYREAVREAVWRGGSERKAYAWGLLAGKDPARVARDLDVLRAVRDHLRGERNLRSLREQIALAVTHGPGAAERAVRIASGIERRERLAAARESGDVWGVLVNGGNLRDLAKALLTPRERDRDGDEDGRSRRDENERRDGRDDRRSDRNDDKRGDRDGDKHDDRDDDKRSDRGEDERGDMGEDRGEDRDEGRDGDRDPLSVEPERRDRDGRDDRDDGRDRDDGEKDEEEKDRDEEKDGGRGVDLGD